MTDDFRLLPYQMRAVDKLRKLRVGAVYSEIPDGNARIALELVRLRLALGAPWMRLAVILSGVAALRQARPVRSMETERGRFRYLLFVGSFVGFMAGLIDGRKSHVWFHFGNDIHVA